MFMFMLATVISSSVVEVNIAMNEVATATEWLATQ